MSEIFPDLRFMDIDSIPLELYKHLLTCSFKKTEYTITILTEYDSGASFGRAGPVAGSVRVNDAFMHNSYRVIELHFRCAGIDHKGVIELPMDLYEKKKCDLTRLTFLTNKFVFTTHIISMLLEDSIDGLRTELQALFQTSEFTPEVTYDWDL